MLKNKKKANSYTIVKSQFQITVRRLHLISRFWLKGEIRGRRLLKISVMGENQFNDKETTQIDEGGSVLPIPLIANVGRVTERKIT